MASAEKLAELVIIGCSVGGGFVMRQLIASGTWDKFNTTVIDKNDFIEWTPNFSSYLLDSALLDKQIISAKDYFEQNNLNQFNMQFIQGDVTNVTSDGVESGGTVEFDSDKGLKTSRRYHYLVISTGAQYGTPIREKPASLSARKTGLHWWKSHVEDSREVVVVGGGAVGVEIAGAIADTYKNDSSKKIHLVTRTARLLERLPPKASKYAEDALSRLKVKIHLKTDADSLKSQLPEALFLPGATKFNAAFLRNSSFQSSIMDNGAIRVNSFQQVENARHVFALGDCCVTPLREEKGILSVIQLGMVLWQNLINKLEGERLKTIPMRIEFLQAIAIGSEDGLLVVNYSLVRTGKSVAEQKSQSSSIFGDLQKELRQLKQYQSVLSTVAIVSSVLACFPVSSHYRECALQKLREGKESIKSGGSIEKISTPLKS